jgi:hypothetical protein
LIIKCYGEKIISKTAFLRFSLSPTERNLLVFIQRTRKTLANDSKFQMDSKWIRDPFLRGKGFISADVDEEVEILLG